MTGANMKYRFVIELDDRAETVRVWDHDFLIDVPKAGRRRAAVCKIEDGISGLGGLVMGLMGLYCPCGEEDWKKLLKNRVEHDDHSNQSQTD